jgi:hypothetical protein
MRIPSVLVCMTGRPSHDHHVRSLSFRNKPHLLDLCEPAAELVLFAEPEDYGWLGRRSRKWAIQRQQRHRRGGWMVLRLWSLPFFIREWIGEKQPWVLSMLSSHSYIQQRPCARADLHENVRYTEGSAAWVLIASIIVFFMVNKVVRPSINCLNFFGCLIL